jgi:surface polysaccharide O-acyltransferase-like enzyme
MNAPLILQSQIGLIIFGKVLREAYLRFYKKSIILRRLQRGINKSMKKKYLIWNDVIRVVAMIMVLLLHASAPYVDRFQHVPLYLWNYANLINSITRASVPLFFLLSGMLLLGNQEEPALVFYRKRVMRILPPLLFWSVVYIIWGIYHHGEKYTVISAAKDIINGDVRYHLWFVYVLLGLYLITPLLRFLIARLDQGIFYGLIGLWFVIISVFPILTKFTAVDMPLKTENLLLHYLGYYLLGFLLSKTDLSTFRSKIIWLGIWCASSAATIYLTYSHSVDNRAFVGFFYNYTSVNVVIMTVAIFLFLKSLPYDRFFARARFNWLRTAIIELSKISYGIYLGHVLFQEILWEDWPEKILRHPLRVIPAIVVSVGVITVVLLLITRKIPIVKRLVN